MKTAQTLIYAGNGTGTGRAWRHLIMSPAIVVMLPISGRPRTGRPGSVLAPGRAAITAFKTSSTILRSATRSGFKPISRQEIASLAPGLDGPPNLSMVFLRVSARLLRIVPTPSCRTCRAAAIFGGKLGIFFKLSIICWTVLFNLSTRSFRSDGMFASPKTWPMMERMLPIGSVTALSGGGVTTSADICWANHLEEKRNSLN